MKFTRVIIAALFAGSVGSVLADPPPGRGNGEGKPDKHKAEKQKKKHGAEPRSHFIEDDRIIVRDFYAQNPSSLPPGLAKRGGNLPPGLAKRGGNLPPGLSKGQVITVEDYRHLPPLPRELELRLPPPPHEVVRRIIGRDIVLIHQHTRKVLDVLHDALPHP